MNATRNAEAVAKLMEMGAAKERREDSNGKTITGWWLDGVWLAPVTKPQDAVRAVLC